MSRKYRCIILNQCSIHPNYNDIIKAARSTWFRNVPDNVIVLNYYGSSTGTDGKISVKPNGDMIINIPDLRKEYEDGVFDSRAEKFILALEYVNNNFDFDYVYRISCTSYINIDKMLRFLDNIRDNKIYCGCNNLYDYKISFNSGFHVMMSKDIVDSAVKNKEVFLKNKYLPEDVAFGKLIVHDLRLLDSENLDTQPMYVSHVNYRGVHANEVKKQQYPVFNYRLAPHLVDAWYKLHEKGE